MTLSKVGVVTLVVGATQTYMDLDIVKNGYGYELVDVSNYDAYGNQTAIKIDLSSTPYNTVAFVKALVNSLGSHVEIVKALVNSLDGHIENSTYNDR